MKIRSFFVVGGLLFVLGVVLFCFLLTPESGWVALTGLLVSIVASRLFWWHVYKNYDRTGGNDYGEQVRCLMTLGYAIVFFLATPLIFLIDFSCLAAFVAGLINIVVTVVGSLKVTRWY
jgi:hypothetical protein